ncbi:MAG: hypothetical protein AB7G05_01440 [Hyphomonadaceae bacterium]
MPMTEQTEYWFARRFPFGDRRNAMAPVHWKGWAVSLLFVCVLTAGGVLFAWMGARGEIVKGAASFVAVAFFATVFFIGATQRKGDLVRTVADYKKDRQSV